MKDSELILKDLIAISVRLQECEYIAKRAKMPHLATDCRDAGEKVAAEVRRLMIPDAGSVLS